jgi:glucans biosynthesis protein C
MSRLGYCRVFEPSNGAPLRAERIVALDAVRAIAMLLGVLLHGAISYMTIRVPGLIWVTHDRDSSPCFDVLFWWLHSFRLPLFFYLGGFFAALLEDHRGRQGLLMHRTRRLLGPLIAATLLILPISYYIWSCGWLIGGRCTVKQILAVKFDAVIQRELFGPLHLWFLEDLFLLTLAWCAISRVLESRPNRWTRIRYSIVHELVKSRLSLLLPVCLAIPTFLLLAANLETVVDHHNRPFPDFRRLLYYGTYFVPGAMVYRGRDALKAIFRHWAVNLVLAILIAAAMVLLLKQYHDGHTRVAPYLAVALSLTAWFSLFGVIGVALIALNGQRPGLRYLADASYWVYLIHLPIVGLVQLDLEGVAMPVGLKYAVVIAVTLILSLSSYHALVRYTAIGRWLHGPRQRGPNLDARPRRRLAA